jgi:serine/threonine protein kinase
MVSRHPPFLRASCNDNYYRYLVGNRADLFWAIHSKNKPVGYYSEPLTDLLQWMFSYNPMERPSVAEIMTHEWFSGTVPTQDEIKDAFELKKSVLIQQNYQPSADVPAGTPDPSVLGKGTFRSHINGKKIERDMVKYQTEFRRYTQFFSTSDPESLMTALALFAKEK